VSHRIPAVQRTPELGLLRHIAQPNGLRDYPSHYPK
jgi:hypothetical protein